ncbi:SET domain-containing protein [Cavenderia fasciculata]|uniref:SET domain-containing protein n=1 Tax=Cavenderia fasciculata TaxID=261658 RepID=F4PL30_CACFS|nr:SET domain-containing protein [Cavenderia fasciculata]EGG23252.1 SET domain-containing protein [Cavenderia fasciculata]|eukprot:XP_004361103.1 SET domain-containing protein [Cavenderia fasciculata]
MLNRPLHKFITNGLNIVNSRNVITTTTCIQNNNNNKYYYSTKNSSKNNNKDKDSSSSSSSPTGELVDKRAIITNRLNADKKGDGLSQEMVDEIYRQNQPKDKSHLPLFDMSRVAVNRYLEEAYSKAAEEYEKGEYQQALERYFWIINKVPYESAAYLQRAVVYETIHSYEEAIQDCDKVISMSNSSDQIAEAYMLKGHSLMGRTKFSEAATAFKDSLMYVENEEVMELMKKALSLVDPDQIMVPRFEDDYQFFSLLSQEMDGNALIKNSKLHGRGLFATRDFDAEELVFETRSLFSISDKADTKEMVEHDSEHCHNCQINFRAVAFEHEQVIERSREYKRLVETVSNMTRLPVGRIEPVECPDCKRVHYCSTDCQQDNHESHVHICERDIVVRKLTDQLKVEISAISDATERLCYTLMYRLFAHQSPNGDQSKIIRTLELDHLVKRLAYAQPSSFQTQPQPQTQTTNEKETTTKFLAPSALAAQRVLSKKDQKVYKIVKDIFSSRHITEELFYRIKSIIQLNMMCFFTSRVEVQCTPSPMDELGYNFDFVDVPDKSLAGLPVHISFMNHSCSPNVVISSPIINDKQIRIITTRPIRRGDEILISYIEGEKLTTEHRRQSLNESFGFVCQCPMWYLFILPTAHYGVGVSLEEDGGGLFRAGSGGIWGLLFPVTQFSLIISLVFSLDNQSIKLMMYYAATPTMTFVAPQAMQGMWYYNLYAQLQQQQLAEMYAWFMNIYLYQHNINICILFSLPLLLGMDRNRSGSISHVELQYLVIGGTALGIDTASKLIKCFDRNRNGTVDFYEYAALHQFINVLHRCFVANDRNYSGTIDCNEIHSALATAGFMLPFHTVQLFFLKYSPVGMGILFTQFLNLCASIALCRSLFEWSDPARTGMVHITLQQMLDMFALA